MNPKLPFGAYYIIGDHRTNEYVFHDLFVCRLVADSVINSESWSRTDSKLWILSEIPFACLDQSKAKISSLSQNRPQHEKWIVDLWTIHFRVVGDCVIKSKWMLRIQLQIWIESEIPFTSLDQSEATIWSLLQIRRPNDKSNRRPSPISWSCCRRVRNKLQILASYWFRDLNRICDSIQISKSIPSKDFDLIAESVPRRQNHTL
jgi:hypothetical protein